MKIAFDWSLVPGERAGIGQYSYNLAYALSRVDKVNEYIFYVLMTASSRASIKDGSIAPPPGNFHVEHLTIPFPYHLFRYIKVPGMGATFKEYMLGNIDADIFHNNTFCVPRFRDKKKKVVVTVYDLSVLTNPECHKKMNIKHCLGGIRDAIKYADAIIAISEHTKSDLINYLNAPEDLITVTHLAAGPEYHEVRDPAALAFVRARYSLPENYVLFVGSLEPRKNIKTLLKAYSVVPARLRKDFPLVIAGAKGWLNSDIPSLVEGLGMKESVRFTGYIDGHDISAVYSGASVFAYPSLYEGFGLPILEAMSCGAPVITSNTSSMPEVAGDAARLVDPLDTEELADALETVLDNENLRVEMKKKGLVRAASFSWDRCARETLEVYGKVAASPKRN